MVTEEKEGTPGICETEQKGWFPLKLGYRESLLTYSINEYKVLLRIKEEERSC